MSTTSLLIQVTVKVDSSDWQVEIQREKEELRYVLMESGAQSVGNSG